MEDRSGKTILISLGIYLLILVVTALVNKNSLEDVGAAGFVGGIVLFIIGAIVSIPRKTRDIGSGLLIVSLIIAVIGFGVCSTNFKI